MVKHTQTILEKNYLSVFDHFVGLMLKGPMLFTNHFQIRHVNITRLSYSHHNKFKVKHKNAGYIKVFIEV